MKLNLYTILFASALTLPSCTGDWLDVDPTTAVDSEKAIYDLKTAQIALNGAYRIAASHSYYGDNYLYYGDCRGEDVQARISKGPGGRVSPYYEFNVTETDPLNVVRVWNQPYSVIHQVNSLIEKIDNGNVTTTETATLARVKAEALALRGLALYDLTAFFGMPYTFDQGKSPGVPIEIKPELPSHAPARNTVAECYRQVIADMTAALPDLSPEKKDGFMNAWSVKALLSRIYLNMGDNENALKYAQDVIDNGKMYRLYTHDEYATVWGKDFSAESLFEFYYTMTEPAGGTGGEGAPMVYADNTKGWNNLVLTKAYLDLLGEDSLDVRHSLTHAAISPDDDLPAGAGAARKYLAKYPGKSGNAETGNPQDNNICVIRLSEVYLNAAEAAFKLGKPEALTYLNAIVSRANPEKSVAEGELNLERILKERRKELVGEGRAFFDYLRNGIAVNRAGGWHLPTIPANAVEIKPSDPRVILPIPQAEIDANPNMTQNPR